MATRGNSDVQVRYSRSFTRLAELHQDPKARNKIRQWFSKERRTEAIEEARRTDPRYAQTQFAGQYIAYPRSTDRCSRRPQLPERERCVRRHGDGQISTQNVIWHLVKDAGADEVDEEVEQEVLPLKPIERKASSSFTGVSVKGVGDVSVKLARCCMPVPGSQIVGFVTRNQGVSVHRTDCQNIIDLKNKQS